MAMSPAMLAALQAMNPTLVMMVKIEFEDRTVRMIEGSGYVAWGADVYQGSDPEIGTIAGFGGFEEAEGTESPRQSIQFYVKNNDALVKLTAPSAQGTPVTIYAATINRATGQLIGVPDVRFAGEIDDAEVSFGKNERLLTLELSTAWERLFDNNEGARWNDTFWTYLFGSGAHAFAGVNNVLRKNYWGYKGPPVNISGGGYVGGGGGFGGGGYYQNEVV